MCCDHYYFLPEMTTRRYLVAQTVLQTIALLTFPVCSFSSFFHVKNPRRKKDKPSPVSPLPPKNEWSHKPSFEFLKVSDWLTCLKVPPIR